LVKPFILKGKLGSNNQESRKIKGNKKIKKRKMKRRRNRNKKVRKIKKRKTDFEIILSTKLSLFCN